MERKALVGLTVIMVVVVGLMMGAVGSCQDNGGAPPPAAPQVPAGGALTGGGGGHHGAGAGAGAHAGGHGMLGLLTQWGATKDDGKKLKPYMQQRQQSLADLRQAADALKAAVSAPGATDEQVQTAVTAFQQKRDATEQQLKTAQQGLFDALLLGTRPKLAAGLTLMGVLDNGLGRNALAEPGQHAAGAAPAAAPAAAATEAPAATTAPAPAAPPK